MVEKHNDPVFGEVIDFELLRRQMRPVYDYLYPEFNMIASVELGAQQYDKDPSYMVAGGASLLAYTILLAAEEYELAEQTKDSLFTLGWTEEHLGSDLLSAYTQATPLSDDPNERRYHIKGRKWLINNSFHADYHTVVAKLDPTQNGPRSLSLFLVPHSSTKNWQRLDTHVLRNMVLTTFDIDGEGILLGKVGHGLSILQRMSMPAKYICTFAGITMMEDAIAATITHLSNKRIFSENPINFSNVYRQMYNIAQHGAFYSFLFWRAVAFSDTDQLQFHGTMLKSWLLLRLNELLGKNLLVAGSKGFLKESPIGRNAIDSFVLPVFDGHYTINTLMSAKQLRRYINATRKEDLVARHAFLRENLFKRQPGQQISSASASIRNPNFFDWADYWRQLNVPVAIDADALLDRVRHLLECIEASPQANEPENKYKLGTLVQWLEALLAAGDFWALYGDAYLNTVVQQYNEFVTAFNDIIAEGNWPTEFLVPLRQLPIEQPAEAAEALTKLLNISQGLQQPQP